ncbi:MAG: hypothetical protein Q9160_005600 [Pyrenula sp. 1 TL-2023]
MWGSQDSSVGQRDLSGHNSKQSFSSSLTGSIAAEASGLGPTGGFLGRFEPKKSTTHSMEREPICRTSSGKEACKRPRGSPQRLETSGNSRTSRIHSRGQADRFQDSLDAEGSYARNSDAPPAKRSRPMPDRHQNYHHRLDRDSLNQSEDDRSLIDPSDILDDLNDEDSVFSGSSESSRADRMYRKRYADSLREELRGLYDMNRNPRRPAPIKTQCAIGSEADADKVPWNVRKDLENWLKANSNPQNVDDLIGAITTTDRRFKAFPKVPDGNTKFFSKNEPCSPLVPLVCTPAQLKLKGLEEYTANFLKILRRSSDAAYIVIHDKEHRGAGSGYKAWEGHPFTGGPLRFVKMRTDQPAKRDQRDPCASAVRHPRQSNTHSAHNRQPRPSTIYSSDAPQLHTVTMPATGVEFRFWRERGGKDVRAGCRPGYECRTVELLIGECISFGLFTAGEARADATPMIVNVEGAFPESVCIGGINVPRFSEVLEKIKEVDAAVSEDGLVVVNVSRVTRRGEPSDIDNRIPRDSL